MGISVAGKGKRDRRVRRRFRRYNILLAFRETYLHTILSANLNGIIRTYPVTGRDYIYIYIGNVKCEMVPNPRTPQVDIVLCSSKTT